MSQVNADPFLDRLLRSQLVDKKSLREAVAAVQRATGLHQIPASELGRKLVEIGLLTGWQLEQLEAGRSHGFYLGKYKLLDHLGTGGMGEVYLGEHIAMRRRVALKILPHALVDSPSHLARFYQESRATAALSHPNIVQAFDIDKDPKRDIHYMVMEYVDGRDLQQIIQEQGPLPVEKVADYIRQAALGLAHAHEKGLVHRDIKPNNLLVDKTGRVKVLDMGIARIVEQDDEQSLTLACNEQVMGTIDYLAPEQLQDAHRVDARADLYSLGCTMFYLLLGQAPFSKGTMAQRMMKHQIQAPPDIREQRPDVPAELVTICNKLLAKKPDDRYQTATEVAAALGTWLQQLGSLVDGEMSSFSGSATFVGTKTIGGDGPSTELMLSKLLAQHVLTPLQVDILLGRCTEPLTIGKYQILEKINDGRLAGMYRGRHSSLQFPVVLKIVRLAGLTGTQRERLQGQFEHEARVSIQVNHPNVVRTYEVGRDGETCFATIENLSGVCMSELLTAAKRPTVSEACRMIRDAALGLGHLHENEIVHRNICPRNLWVGEDGRVKIIDFSLARDSLQYLETASIEQLLEADTELLGDPEYMAPEQATDSASSTPLSDVYGLGCTLYHALTGRVPFSSASATKLVLKHATLSASPPSAYNPHISPELDEFVMLMMAKSQQQRVRSMSLVAQVLEMFIN